MRDAVAWNHFATKRIGRRYGRGVALATSMGQQPASQLVGGETAQTDLPITPLRPIRFHAAWPIGVRSAVPVGRFRDRLGL